MATVSSGDDEVQAPETSYTIQNGSEERGEWGKERVILPLSLPPSLSGYVFCGL